MLATQANYLVQNNSIARDSIISLNRFVVNPVQGRKIVILLEVEVLGSVPKIGSPTNVDEDLQAGTLTAPPPPVMQQNTSLPMAGAPTPAAGGAASDAYNAYQNNRYFFVTYSRLIFKVRPLRLKHDLPLLPLRLQEHPVVSRSYPLTA